MPISGGSTLTPQQIWAYLNDNEEICEDTGVGSGAVDVFGAWTQLIAATVADIYAINLCLSEPTNWTVGGQTIEIGIGAPAAEVMILSLQGFNSSAVEDIGWGGIVDAIAFIPAGSRVAMRIRNRVGAAVQQQVAMTGRINV